MIFKRPAILRGEVVHNRIRPVKHRLSYSVFSILIDLDDTESLSEKFLFSLDRFNLLSFNKCDMADGGQTDLATCARKRVFAETGIDTISRVWLLTFPRLLGYVFNPLSVYFCLDENRTPLALIYEVSNTFGDRETYVCKVMDGRVEHASKQMLVSPFNATEGDYSFSLLTSEEEITIGVALHEGGKAILKTHLRSKACPFSDTQILKVIAAYPFMTLKVILAIHFEAAKLWLKGLRFPMKVSHARKAHDRDAGKTGTQLHHFRKTNLSTSQK